MTPPSSTYSGSSKKDVTLKEAAVYAKGVLKFLGYVGALIGAIWYLRGELDSINESLRNINRTLAYKPSIAEVNHAFKTLGDDNREVVRKDGSTGIFFPEIPPPTVNVSGPSTSP